MAASPEPSRLRDFLSGLVAGIISVSACNPLDIARTRLNLMSSPNHPNNKYTGFLHALRLIWREEGIRGYYTGYWINVKAIPLFHSLFFPIYEASKQWCRHRGYPKWAQYIASTVVAGGFCNVVTNPIWVVRTRVMVQFLHSEDRHYAGTSIIKIMKQMIKEEGIGSLFKGLSASLLGISNAVIYFFLYESIKQRVQTRSQDFSTGYVFLASILCKLIASTVTYPFIVVRTILHDHRAESEMGLRRIIGHIWRERGAAGLYAGLKPDLVRLLPSNAIVFVVYELMKKNLV